MTTASRPQASAGESHELALDSERDRKLLERYRVTLLDAAEIQPSPENDELYGVVGRDDPSMPVLIRSIQRLGLEEPLILTSDKFILSGHRRFHALRNLGWDRIPVRFTNVTREHCADYHRLLAQYNPQRVKTVASTLAESLLQNEDDENSGVSWSAYHRRNAAPMESMSVTGQKTTGTISSRRSEFIAAAKRVVAEMRDYWPLTVRQVHYKLLNNPPMTQTTAARNERWLYRNNQASYAKLSCLLRDARYSGDIAWEAIDDSTRESRTRSGFSSVREFVDQNVSEFLVGYHRDRREGQSHHVECLVEKNTLLNVVEDICRKFYLPLTPLRGYGGPSVWERIESRWRAHPNPDAQCVVIILSDHDPEGLNLADDCVRSLRDLHGVPVHPIRPLVTLEQVQHYDLPPNPAKESSSRFSEYVRKTGTRSCWECEALDPGVIRQTLHDAILSVTDVDLLNAVQEREQTEKTQLSAIRRRIGSKLVEMVQEGEL